MPDRRSVLAALFTAVALLTACGGPNSSATGAEQTAADETPLEQARDDCHVPVSAVGDDGATLILDHKGEEDASGLSIDQIVCVLLAVDMPDALVARLDSTRAMDGVQTGSWPGYTVTWSYHPDSGVDLILELAQ
jgi:hypothetical protein